MDILCQLFYQPLCYVAVFLPLMLIVIGAEE